MKYTVKEFAIPRCLERTPELFGLSVQTAIISSALILVAIIMIAKSIWISLVLIAIVIVNLKMINKGGIMSYFLLMAVKQDSIRMNCTIKSLIQQNKNKNKNKNGK